MNVLLILSFVLSPILAQESSIKSNDQFYEASTTIKLYHSFDDSEYFLRGTILIDHNNEGDAKVKQDKALSINEIASLKKSSSNDGLYFLKAIAYSNDSEESRSATTFLKSCSVYESGLSDIIFLTFDLNNNFLGISVTTTNPQCVFSANAIPSKLTIFNSTLFIEHTSLAPSPDTQTFIQRLEREKAEKMRGDRTDNRSFLAKYWMYIVPIVVFLMISSASNVEQGAGGGR